ncbi:F-box [Acanthamoeba polyphaga mimivirus]|uniref:F-box n=1 Tax=Acanthamoeba polyphaga mimivirus TaxID=212035 RepID=A0A2L2DKJ6_MIMIV|nr:F-box [Acanthamoeba polyphaga mimivirus]
MDYIIKIFNESKNLIHYMYRLNVNNCIVIMKVYKMLPEEIWYNIFIFLNINELIKFSKVCSQFRRICLDEYIWCQKAEFIKGQSIIEQYAKWKKKLKYDTSFNCAIERLGKNGEKIITRFSKNYTLDILTNDTLIPGIMIDPFNNINQSMSNALNKIYSSFHRKNIFRLDSYAVTKSVNIKHDLRRFYIIVVPPNYEDSINLVQYYLNTQNDRYWINIFAIICSPNDQNILLKHKFNIFDAKTKIFDFNQYPNIFRWIAKMVWIDDFKFGQEFCPKQIPTRKELHDLTTESIFPISNICHCQ